jgi:hypothetical protein
MYGGLSMYFKRDYRHDNTIFRGDFEAEVIQKRTIIQKERIHLRLKAYEHEEFQHWPIPWIVVLV